MIEYISKVTNIVSTIGSASESMRIISVTERKGDERKGEEIREKWKRGENRREDEVKKKDNQKRGGEER